DGAPSGLTRRFQFGRVTWVLLALGAGLSIVWGIALIAAPIDDDDLVGSTAMATLNDAGEALRGDIARLVEPAMRRTEKLASDEPVIAALGACDKPRLTAACNEAITAATEVDAIALFDADSRIVALNTVYASGETIEPARIARVLDTDFSARK